MRCIILDLLKIFMWLAVACMAGCSAFYESSTPHPPLKTAGSPTSLVTADPASLPFYGKIAFVKVKISDDYLPDYRLQVMNADGSERIDITPPNLRDISFPVWSPDGQYIAFLAWKDDQRRVFKIKPDGSGLVQLPADDVWEVSPSWSSDGQSILFTSSSPDLLDDSGSPAGHPYIMKSDGTQVRRLVVKTRPDNVNVSGVFRANGLIAVSEPVTRFSSANYIVNLSGEIQKQFPKLVMAELISWSPDGNWIAYSPDPRFSKCWGIEIMKFDQSESQCLLKQKPNSFIYFASISWSPDGKYILFSSNLNGDWNIYAMKTDGSGLTQLTDEPGHEDSAVWSLSAQK